MKAFKYSITTIILLSFLVLTTGCPDFRKTKKTEAEVIVQAPCTKDKLKIEITKVTNDGKSGNFYYVSVKVKVTCDGEPIPAKILWNMCECKMGVDGSNKRGG